MIRFKDYFFDSAKVIKRTDRATRRALSKFGAFVRRTSKQSIRKRKKTSAPGKPPSSHTGLLKKFIFFGYDARNKSVVIGPERLSQNKRGDAPSVLEYGGSIKVKRRGQNRSVKIKQRPFMGPAFEKEKQNLPSIWKNSIK